MRKCFEAILLLCSHFKVLFLLPFIILRWIIIIPGVNLNYWAYLFILLLLLLPQWFGGFILDSLGVQSVGKNWKSIFVGKRESKISEKIRSKKRIENITGRWENWKKLHVCQASGNFSTVWFSLLVREGIKEPLNDG